MRGGDIDNALAPGIGMRFERVIKTEEGKLNRSAKAYLESVTKYTNVYLITTGDKRRAMAFCVKWAVPYFQVIESAGPLEIPDIVREHDMIMYFDADKEVLQNINSRGYQKVETKLWTSVELL